MNRGEMAEVMPSAKPMMRRPMIRSATLRATQELTVQPTMKSAPLMMMVFRRPMRSAGMPASRLPTVAPSRRIDTTLPFMPPERPNSSVMRGSASLMLLAS